MKTRAPIAHLAAGTHRLPSGTAHYLRDVLRLGEGDSFVAFDPVAHTEARACLAEVSRDAVVATIEEPHAPTVMASTPLCWIQGFAKGDKVDAIVRDATELGATRIVVVQTERAVPRVTGRAVEAKLARWRRVADQAARQCGRSDPPFIDGVVDWERGLEVGTACDTRICLDPRAGALLGGLLLEPARRGVSMAFAVGPEGGLSAEEVDQARQRGYEGASMGSFVLRTETVAAAVLGAVRIFGV